MGIFSSSTFLFGTVCLLDLSQWDFGPKFAENAYKQKVTGQSNLFTLHLNEKFLSTKTPWDFDANLEISDSNWSISDPKIFYQFTDLAVNPG